MENIKKENLEIEEKKEFWLITKIKTYAKENPKRTFIIMFSLIVFSFLLSIGQLIYVRLVEVPKYEQMKTTKIFIDAGNSLTEPLKATENVLDIRATLKELEYYKNKKNLTKQDSIKIKYLIDKYKNIKK